MTTNSIKNTIFEALEDKLETVKYDRYLTSTTTEEITAQVSRGVMNRPVGNALIVQYAEGDSILIENNGSQDTIEMDIRVYFYYSTGEIDSQLEALIEIEKKIIDAVYGADRRLSKCTSLNWFQTLMIVDANDVLTQLGKMLVFKVRFVM